jgi:hypothetical protein
MKSMNMCWTDDDNKKLVLRLGNILFFVFLLPCFFILMNSTNIAALPVFPGADGFGSTTPAGRGGTVYRVTNLNDDGAGSLRECTDASGPRVCVFEVSGTITLSSNIEITKWNDYK